MLCCPFLPVAAEAVVGVVVVVRISMPSTQPSAIGPGVDWVGVGWAVHSGSVVWASSNYSVPTNTGTVGSFLESSIHNQSNIAVGIILGLNMNNISFMLGLSTS